MPTVLFCADPLDPRRTDPHFAREARAVRDQSGTVALIDHDALGCGDLSEAVRGVPTGLGPAWYRGWMVTGAQYTALATALQERGCGLIVHPGDFVRAHELPGWVDHFAGLTPRSVWIPLSPGEVPSVETLAELVAPLAPGPAVVKDFVKSRKHEWADACYVPDLQDLAALHRVAARMIELQDGGLSGGLVVREYEPYAPGETRVWWIDGEPALVGAHPDEPDRVPGPATRSALTEVRAAVRALGCRFVTTDLAWIDRTRPAAGDGHGDEHGDGTGHGPDPRGTTNPRVVEVGDGQVSDLPVSADPADLYLRLPEPAPHHG